MKAVKILSLLCSILFINGLLQINISAQIKETSVQTTSTTAKKQEIKSPETANRTDADSSQTPASFEKKSDERYRIGFQDTIEVRVFRHDELSQVVNVSPDGTIILPRIDQPITAVCKTERELGDSITNYYKTYLRNPFVNVRVVEQKSQPFAVIGAVEKPGSFYLNRKIRLLELLAFAGGPKVEKAGSKIQVARVGNQLACPGSDEPREEDGDVQFLAFNLKDVTDGKENPWMEPGDIVSVLEAEEAYVVGEVYKPAKVSLKDPVTLTQAIAIAGGISSTAKTDKVIIERQETGSALKTELVFDLKDIKDKKIPDPLLQANDIVSVSNDKIKSVKNSLLKIVTGGLGNVFYRIP